MNTARTEKEFAENNVSTSEWQISICATQPDKLQGPGTNLQKIEIPTLAYHLRKVVPNANLPKGNSGTNTSWMLQTLLTQLHKTI